SSAPLRASVSARSLFSRSDTLRKVNVDNKSVTISSPIVSARTVWVRSWGTRASTAADTLGSSSGAAGGVTGGDTEITRTADATVVGVCGTVTLTVGSAA